MSNLNNLKIIEIAKTYQRLKNRMIPQKVQEIFALKEKVKPAIELERTLKHNEIFGPLQVAKDVTNILSILKTIPDYEEQKALLAEIFPSSITEYELEQEDYDNSKSDKQTVLKETDRIKRIITDIYQNNLVLFDLHSREFEEMIAELLRSQGFEVQLTKQTRDNGYDILALQTIVGHTPIKSLVECKRYREDRKIGVEIVRSFMDVIRTEQANKGIIITTSYFSRDSIAKQIQNPYLLDLRDKDKVLEWVTTYQSRKP